MKHDVFIEEVDYINGRAKRVCIDGTWYRSLSQIPQVPYASIIAYRTKHNLSTEEAIDSLLCYHEKRDERRRKKLALQKEEDLRKASKFVYHGECFPSFSQAVRVIGRRHGLELVPCNVSGYIRTRNLDKVSGLDEYILREKNNAEAEAQSSCFTL